MPGGLAINRKVARILASERIFRNGDCANWTEIACFNVSSKTESPVLLLKSASTTVSCSLNWCNRRWRTLKPTAATTTIASVAMAANHSFRLDSARATRARLPAAMAFKSSRTSVALWSRSLRPY